MKITNCTPWATTRWPALAYVLVFLVASVMGITGFAMRGQINPGGFFDTLFGWVIPLLGDEANVRFVHRLGMWLLIVFIIHHVSLCDLPGGAPGERDAVFDDQRPEDAPPGWKPKERPWE